MLHRKHHESHTEESIRLSDQAARVAERAQLAEMEPQELVDDETRERQRIISDALATATGQLLSDGLPPNPITPPEVPARKYMLGHDPLCVYRHNQACRCTNKEPLP